MRTILKKSELPALRAIYSNFGLLYTYKELADGNLDVSIYHDDNTEIAPGFALMLGRQLEKRIQVQKELDETMDRIKKGPSLNLLEKI